MYFRAEIWGGRAGEGTGEGSDEGGGGRFRMGEEESWAGVQGF